MRKLKESGIEWIGMIPEQWELIRVKNIFKYHKDIVGEKEEEYDRLALTLNGVIKRDKNDSKGLQSKNFSTYQILKEKELVFKMIDLANVNTSRVGYSPFTGIVSPVYIILNNDEYSKYGYYYFYSMWQREIFNNLGNDGVRSALNATDMLNLPFLKISKDISNKIATFLDKEVSEIDNAIKKTKETIEDYKKLKQSIITQTIKEGLNNTLDLKDSGVDFIGNINSKYSVCDFKYILKENMQYGANESGIAYDEKLPRYIRITDISDAGDLKDSGKLSLTEESAKGYILEHGDILFARSGATVGKSFIYKEKYGNCAFAGYLIKAKVKNNIDPDYVYYYTLSSIYEIWKNGIFIQATIQNIGAEKYRNMPIIVPDNIKEQNKIVKYLDEKCNEIDKLIENKEKIIEELEQYKKSVIYEYVTGKKEVK